MTEHDFILQDRLGVIKSVIAKECEDKFYLSFSGGKDSTILHYLLDMALPNNKIPRVYIDTGIEFKAVRKYVISFAENDVRFHIIKPTQPIKNVLDMYGYPFKSKEHSHMVSVFQHSGVGKSVRSYLGVEGTKLVLCPKCLSYQFSADFKIKCSDQCCLRLKKKPISKWQCQSGRSITITGMRKAEGGQRASIQGCVLTDKNGHIKKFHPLLVVSDDWENWFVNKFNIRLCELYYPPFNFKRTGCKGCPFSIDLQEQLTTMELYLPDERIQCEHIWKPVYDEYRRIGFRLGKTEQLRLF